MNRIEFAVLNPDAVKEAEKTMVCAARLTQRGHMIRNMNDFMELYNKDYKKETCAAMASLPHPTIQKFGVINVAVVGASRRFLAQITRHQNEVKFMSASLQYSDYSSQADFVVPYEILGTPRQQAYLRQCAASMEKYKLLLDAGVDNDACGYLAPQGLRNVLIISATPYQWKHMISQRVCRRNTPETRYIMLNIWAILGYLSPTLFKDCGPFCQQGKCKEGKMTCGRTIRKSMRPQDILKEDFPNICE